MRDGHLDAHAPEVAPADVATGLHAAGLSCAEAARRLASVGPNTTPDEQRSAVRRLVHKFVAPVPCLLEVAIILQLVLHEYFEAAVIAVLLVFNAVLGFVQEGRAQATIAALKSRLALVSSVRRDGRWITVPAADVVPGDVIKLVLGGIVAADVRVCDGMVLLDQSMLTGESLPVEATEGALAWAGALVRRGEAVAEVVATGARTRFGRTAELVRTAHAVSSQQKAVFRVVVAIAAINGAAALALIGYALATRMPVAEVIPLALIAVLASVPVALPATFTLAGALGAQALARKGVIPTRLSAVDEAATMDLLCVDKTGTLTRNVLAVTAVVPMPGFSVEAVLAPARLASADAGPDPLDAAIRAEIDTHVVDGAWSLVSFTPFDPATKRAEATARRADGDVVRIAKGAFAHILAMADAPPDAEAQAVALERKGLRVLGVATNETGHMTLTGLLAFSDPPRRDTAACVTRLRELGLAIVMVTGDAAVTADVIARQVGLDGAVAPADAIATGAHLADYAVFAGVLPADKHALVKAFQAAGRTVGMCGDGANDAPALRQAQIGIAVSTATDVARSAAGLVLTEPGLSGILDAVIAGRLAFQRILTYTLRSIIHKVRQVLFLAAGLIMTGHAILTPTLVVISMIIGDALAMSATTDNVHPSPRPNRWQIGHLTIAGVIMGAIDLVFCVAVLAVARYRFGLDIETLRTLTLVTLVFSGQALFYVVRERRRMWASRPSKIVVACSIADLLIIPTLAVTGTLMAPLPVAAVMAILAACVAFALVLDTVKIVIFRHLSVT